MKILKPKCNFLVCFSNRKIKMALAVERDELLMLIRGFVPGCLLSVHDSLAEQILRFAYFGGHLLCTICHFRFSWCHF